MLWRRGSGLGHILTATLGGLSVALSVLYLVASRFQAEEASRTLVTSGSSVVWVVLYPSWFFQALYLFIFALVMGTIVTGFPRLALTVFRGETGLTLAADFLFIAYLLSVSMSAGYNIVTGGPVRIVWFPFVSASAYTFTVLVYCATGLWLYRRFRWKAVVPLATIGVLQEATWNLAYYTLYPNFLSVAATKSWLEYVAVIAIATPLLLLAQWRWFVARIRNRPLAWVFPAYFLLYYILGMPTLQGGAPMAAHAHSLLFEITYVATCAISYLAAVDLKVRESGKRGSRVVPGPKN